MKRRAKEKELISFDGKCAALFATLFWACKPQKNRGLTFEGKKGGQSERAREISGNRGRDMAWSYIFSRETHGPFIISGTFCALVNILRIRVRLPFASALLRGVCISRAGFRLAALHNFARRGNYPVQAQGKSDSESRFEGVPARKLFQISAPDDLESSCYHARGTTIATHLAQLAYIRKGRSRKSSANRCQRSDTAHIHLRSRGVLRSFAHFSDRNVKTK